MPFLKKWKIFNQEEFSNAARKQPKILWNDKSEILKGAMMLNVEFEEINERDYYEAKAKK